MTIPMHIFPDANLVAGDGPIPCPWMVVGEAPGAEEDRVGKPFVGRAGKLLTKLLTYYTELRRPNIYVTNVVKHRPPGNRTPKASEVKAYMASFVEEVERVGPKVVITVGALAAHAFDKKWKMKDEHGLGHVVELGGWSGVVVPWWHTAYALRNPHIFNQMAADALRLHTEVERAGQPRVENEYRLATEGEVVSLLFNSNETEFGFDTETTSPEREGVFMTDEAEMVGWSVSVREHTGFYVAGRDFGSGMRQILESPHWTKVCHNAKFEVKVLRKLGVELEGYEDTKLAAYVLGEARTGLKSLAKQILGATPITYEALTEGGKQVSELDAEVVAPYAAGDADNTLRLWRALAPRLQLQGLYSLYSEVERPLIPVLAGMEAKGMGVDAEACWGVLGKLMEAERGEEERVRERLEELGVEEGEEFNIRSGDQVAAVLEGLEAPLKKRTEAKGRLVVDSAALEGLRTWQPELIDALLGYRKLRTMQVFAKNFLSLRGPDGRLHTSFNQAGHWEEIGGEGAAPSTGRISSSGPNMQNVPHHRARVGEVDWGEKLRGCIVAAPGNLLLSADLGQEEPRIIAVLAGDDTLLEGFEKGKDIYRPATESIYPYTIGAGSDREFKERWEFERYMGKQFFLAWYYGAGGGRLKALDPRLTPADVKRGLAMLDKAHPARTQYLEAVWRELMGYGYVTTLYGRKRWLEKAWSGRAKDREEAKREAANAKVQGTAADILKKALPKIHRELEGSGAALVGTVHDEVLVEVREERALWVAAVVLEAFEGLLPGMELPLEVYVGETWAERRRLL